MTPTPYYSRGGIELYCCDCRELLPTLKADCVVTDPPYRSLDIDVVRGTTTRLVGGHNARAGDRIGSGAWFQTIDDAELSAVLSRVWAALPPTGAAYVFCDVKTGLRVLPSLPVANVLVWDKVAIGMGYSWRRMHEWIAYCPRPEHALRSQSFGDILRAPTPDPKSHPTEKPVSVLARLIENSSDRGDTVLDIFAGVGSTLLAAKSLGRRAIGVELDERFAELAARRLDAYEPLPFDEPRAPAPEPRLFEESAP